MMATLRLSTESERKIFVQNKDTSKFDMALKQSLDTIQSRTAWVQVCSYAGDRAVPKFG